MGKKISIIIPVLNESEGINNTVEHLNGLITSTNVPTEIIVVDGDPGGKTEAHVTKRRSRTESGIPLWLLPQALARTIREWGDALYRISVKRTHWHHFNVTVRTRPIPKELKPRKVVTVSPELQDKTVKRVRTGRRECPV